MAKRSRLVILRDWIATFAVSMVAALYIEHFGWMDQYKNAGLDFWCQVCRRVDLSNVAIVEIDDNDYSNPDLFDERSPLCADTLGRVISKIAQMHPRLIAVDIDTSAKGEYSDFELPHVQVPIVLVRPIKACDDSAAKDSIPGLLTKIANPFYKEEIRVTPLAILGREPKKLPNIPVITHGIDGGLIEDPDGVVRSYSRRVGTVQQDNKSEDTFPWVVATQEFQLKRVTVDDGYQTRLIPFA